jgi:hypothetical protein
MRYPQSLSKEILQSDRSQKTCERFSSSITLVALTKIPKSELITISLNLSKRTRIQSKLRAGKQRGHLILIKL